MALPVYAGWVENVAIRYRSNRNDSYTCIRSSKLPVGSHGIVGRRAQKSGHQFAVSPDVLDYIEWLGFRETPLLSKITCAGI